MLLPLCNSPPRSLSPLTAALLLLWGMPAWAQGQSKPVENTPVLIEGDALTGEIDSVLTITGNARLHKGALSVQADRLEYQQATDTVQASGNVKIEQANSLFKGDQARFQVDAFTGKVQNPRFDFSTAAQNETVESNQAQQARARSGYGEAESVQILNQDDSIMRNVSYSSCRRLPGPSWIQDWYLSANSVEFDQVDQTGLAQGAALHFMGVPILALPAMSFPLNTNRKSGWLPPTLGSDTADGLSIGMPYYWNIAPNRDATITPVIKSKRGLDTGLEFRYLEQAYAGTVYANTMPVDSLRGTSRWGLNWSHSQQFALGPEWNPLGLRLNVLRAGDDNYWKDFSNSMAGLTGRLFSTDASLNWTYADWTFGAGVQKWQTLKDLSDTSNIAVPPYDKKPFAQANYHKLLRNGVDVQVLADYTRFESDPVIRQQSNGSRSLAQFNFAYPMRDEAWFVRPNLQVQARNYKVDDAFPNSAGEYASKKTANVVVPTLSVDSGVFLERKTNLFGADILQTLEPRAMYTYTPYQAQNHLPNYDSAAYDFNFSSIFSPNAYSGYDRVSDSHTLTLGANSKFLDASTGEQFASVGAAQRFRFRDQRITLPGGSPATDKLSDVLFSANLQMSKKWGLNSTLQYNPDRHETTRSVVELRYSPSNYRVVNLAYRLQKDSSEQIDLGWQWPLNDLWGDFGQDLGRGKGLGDGRWYSVGRANYDYLNRKLANLTAGIEYDGGCWVSRFVIERSQLGTAQKNTKYMLQLEFTDFARIGFGSNPLSVLKQQVSDYQMLHER